MLGGTERGSEPYVLYGELPNDSSNNADDIYLGQVS